MGPSGMQSVGVVVHWDGDSGGCCMWELRCLGIVFGIYKKELWCVGVAGCGSYCVWESQSVGVTVCGD